MNKKMKTAVILLAIIAALALSFFGGCTLNIFKPTSNSTSDNQTLNIELLEEAYRTILTEYVDPEKIDTQKINESILNGLVEGLDDPYCSYMNQEQYNKSITMFSGQFEGIGAYVGFEDGKVTVIAPIYDTPAEKAGIRSGDVILEVDGKSTADMNLEEVILLIRGPKGTTVTITVLHNDDIVPVKLEIVRAEIQVPSVILEMKDKYAHITITTFTDNTAEELMPVIETIIESEAEGIILDLRSNPGGYLAIVVEVASYFLEEGEVVSVKYSDGTSISDSVNKKLPKTDLPIVVLVNRYSASGSEVLAGALQDYGRAYIAGEKTYGKGSVNQYFELSDGSALYLTIARWATPNGSIIEGEGIQPDEEVDFETVDGIQWAIDYLESQKE